MAAAFGAVRKSQDSARTSRRFAERERFSQSSHEKEDSKQGSKSFDAMGVSGSPKLLEGRNSCSVPENMLSRRFAAEDVTAVLPTAVDPRSQPDVASVLFNPRNVLKEDVALTTSLEGKTILKEGRYFGLALVLSSRILSLTTLTLLPRSHTPFLCIVCPSQCGLCYYCHCLAKPNVDVDALRALIAAGMLLKRVEARASWAWSPRWLSLCTDCVLVCNEKGSQVKDVITLLEIGDIHVWNHAGGFASNHTGKGLNEDLASLQRASESKMSKREQAYESHQLAKGRIKTQGATTITEKGHLEVLEELEWENSGRLIPLHVCDCISKLLCICERHRASHHVLLECSLHLPSLSATGVPLQGCHCGGLRRVGR